MAGVERGSKQQERALHLGIDACASDEDLDPGSDRPSQLCFCVFPVLFLTNDCQNSPSTVGFSSVRHLSWVERT